MNDPLAERQFQPDPIIRRVMEMSQIFDANNEVKGQVTIDSTSGEAFAFIVFPIKRSRVKFWTLKASIVVRTNFNH